LSLISGMAPYFFLFFFCLVLETLCVLFSTLFLRISKRILKKTWLTPNIFKFLYSYSLCLFRIRVRIQRKKRKKKRKTEGKKIATTDQNSEKGTTEDHWTCRVSENPRSIRFCIRYTMHAFWISVITLRFGFCVVVVKVDPLWSESIFWMAYQQKIYCHSKTSVIRPSRDRKKRSHNWSCRITESAHFEVKKSMQWV